MRAAYEHPASYHDSYLSIKVAGFWNLSDFDKLYIACGEHVGLGEHGTSNRRSQTSKQLHSAEGLRSTSRHSRGWQYSRTKVKLSIKTSTCAVCQLENPHSRYLTIGTIEFKTHRAKIPSIPQTPLTQAHDPLTTANHPPRQHYLLTTTWHRPSPFRQTSQTPLLPYWEPPGQQAFPQLPTVRPSPSPSRGPLLICLPLPRRPQAWPRIRRWTSSTGRQSSSLLWVSMCWQRA